MAATMHVTVTKGVRLPGYALPPPVLIPPTAGIFSYLFLNKTEKLKMKKKKKNKQDGAFDLRLASVYIATVPYF